MSQPAVGSMQLYDHVLPALSGGLHAVTSTVVVDTPIAPAPLNTAVHRDFIQVGASGLHLQPTEVLACHPPRNSTGAYEQELPHLVLRDRTLPWERPGPGTTTSMALLLFADGEVGFATLALPSVVGAAAAAAFEAEEPGAAASNVDAVQVLSPSVLAAVLPSRAELDLLAHVRRVNTSDSTLDLDDDDGWLAVVVANRLPLGGAAPVHYHACLVSMEHRDDLYGAPATSSLLLLYRWDFITDVGGTFAELARGLDTRALGEVDGAPTDRGRTTLSRTTREGEPVSATYRGPFTVEADPLPDDPADVSYDAAYELGRLLVAADGPATRDLVEWHRAAAAAGDAAVQHAELHGLAASHAAVALRPADQPLHVLAAATGLSTLLRSLAPRAPHRAVLPAGGDDHA